MHPLSDLPTTPVAARTTEPRQTITALLTAAAALTTTDPERALSLAEQARTVAASPEDTIYADPTVRGTDLARAHLLSGQALHRLARLQEAGQHLGLAASLFAKGDLKQDEVQALIAEAVVRRELGETLAAQEALARALTLAAGDGDLKLQAQVLNQQAGLSMQSGQTALALEQLTAALTVRRLLKDPLGTAQCLNNIGQVHLRVNDLGLALSTLTESYDLLRTINDPTTTAHCLSNIARVHEELGDSEQCYEYTTRALDLARQQSNRTLELYCLNNLADAIYNLHRYQEATTLFGEALELASEIGMPYLIGCAHHGLGLAALGQGRPDDALSHHQLALDSARELGETTSEVDALIGLAEAHAALRDHDDASRYLNAALPLCAEMPKRCARVRRLLAQVAQATGRLDEALEHLWQVLELERTLHDQDKSRRVEQLTVQFDVERAHHEAAVSQLQTQLAKQAILDAETKVALQTQRLVQAQVDVVTRLANAAEYRDDLTGKHTLRVGHVAALIAEHLGLSSETVSVLRVAARLHDVGKIGISDTILQKPAKLTPEEFDLMKQHTVIGEQILSGGESPLLNMAREIALSHHEHWNGNGYPNALSGEQIPLTARIVAVADVYDALSHARPYKRAWTHEEVMAEIARQDGRQFQPEIVAALNALQERGALPLGDLYETGDQLHRLLIEHSEMMAPSRSTSSSNETRLKQELDEMERRYREACARIDTLQIEALTDALTGLPNRRAFEKDLETEIVHASRHGYPLSVVSIDLDGLKLINDADGHTHGDALLKAVSSAILARLGYAGRLYRIGGDEFAIVVKDVAVPGQQAFMARLAQAVLDVQAQGFPAASISAGIASFPEEATLEGDLLRLSDGRMYAGKVARRPNLRESLNEGGTLRTSSERRRQGRRQSDLLDDPPQLLPDSAARGAGDGRN